MPGDSAEAVLSVLICVLDGERVIGRQLAALSRQRCEFPWEVVVADNGSTDATLAVVREWREVFPVPLRIVDASHRRGVSHARNVAARGARGQYLAYCDADDEVRPGWVAQAVAALEEHPVVVGTNREMTEPTRADAPVLNPWVLRGAGVLQGCNFGIRRGVFFEVGGFDESLPPYGNDDGELQQRLRTIGYSVAVAPTMEIFFRPTHGLRARIRKVFLSGVSESVIWHRYPERFAANLSLSALTKNLLLEPWRVVRTARAEGRPSLDRLARGLVLPWAHLVGYVTWVRSNRMGDPVYVREEPVIEIV